MASDMEDRQKLILSDGNKYIELEVDADSAGKLRSDLLYAKRHMLAIEQMLPASVKQHTPEDHLEHLDCFLLLPGDEAQVSTEGIDIIEEGNISGESFVWTNKSSALLCKLRLEMNQMFHGGPRSMKMALWNKCAKNMRKQGFLSVTGEVCRRKWHNLMTTYKRVLESNGQGRSSWELFNMVHAVMEQQATNEPAPQLIVSTLSEPRKRKRRNMDNMDADLMGDVSQNGDLFEIPPICNMEESEEPEFVQQEPKAKSSRSSDHTMKMVLNLRREELEFQQQENERRWEERRQRRRDRLKYQEDKLKAISALTQVLARLAEK